MLAGALIRHCFVARHKALVQGKRVPWELCGGRHAGAGRRWRSGWRRAPQPAAAAAAKPVSFAEVQGGDRPALRDVPQRAAAAEERALHTPELIKQHAQTVYQQAVVLKMMPLNNATQITDDERALIKRWFEAGAPVQLSRAAPRGMYRRPPSENAGDTHDRNDRPPGGRKTARRRAWPRSACSMCW